MLDPSKRGRAAKILGALSATLLLASAAPSEALFLCGHLNRATGEVAEGSSVKLRSECRSSEVQVDPASLGIQAALSSRLVVRTGSPLSTNGSLSTPVVCEPGEVATGGGAITSVSGGAEISVRSSRPQPETEGSTPTGWRISAANANPGTGTITVTAYVVCAAP